MINNRQGGRRRGRGGQQPRGMTGGTGGNRQDNRQRGNAAQLLEKYKSMARDAQLAGDRVQTEYYLQFADHYFRVLGESRVRFDEQRRQRGDDDQDDDDLVDAEMDQDDEGDDQPQAQQQSAPPRRPRVGNDRPDRAERPQRAERADRPDRGDRPDRNDRRPNGRDRDEARDEVDERIDFAVLPPAIGGDLAGNEANDDNRDYGDDLQRPVEVEADEAPRPRRRARRPRDEADDSGT